MSTIEKQCVICGDTCVGQPRIRNEKGQYAHRACAEAKQAAMQTAKPEPMQNEPDPDLAALGFDDDGFGDMSDLLPDTPPEPQQPAMRAACPSCGTALDSGVVVCLNCGYNTASGKALKTKAKEKSTSAAGGALVSGVAGKAGGASLAIFMPIVGAIVAGAIGATIWAAIGYFTGFELGILAWAIGGLVGVGALIGARGDGNLWVGCVAAVIAVGSILGGKYVMVSMYLNESFTSGIVNAASNGMDDFEFEQADASWVQEAMAWEIVDEREAEGDVIAWANGLDPYAEESDGAYWPEDFPDDIQSEVLAEWNALSSIEQRERIEMQQRIYEEFAVNMRDAFGEAVMKEGFISTFGMFDLVWLFFALATAYGIGAQED